MARRRGFGEVERRVSASGTVTHRARYAMPDGTRYSRTLATRMDAEAWLVSERGLIDRDVWTPPQMRRAAEEKRQREAAHNTVAGFAERYLAERSLRPTTIRGYRKLLANRILPYFGEMPLIDVSLAEIKRWRASLDPTTVATNAAAYRLLRSLLQAAEEEELIDRAPPKVRGASSAPVKNVAQPATFDELAVIVDNMPERLRLLIVLAAFVGLREGELLELRRSDVDGVTGRVHVTRKVDKDADPTVPGACPNCGRHIGSPKTRSGKRTVHVPPPFLKMLQQHLLEHTAEGPHGLVFPGDRTDHMSVRYLMDRYRPAREAAGRPDLTIHHLRHTALTLAGQQGATAAELQARAGHASQAAMAIYQHATLDRDKALAEKIGETYVGWRDARSSE
jgi:integrase